MARITSLGEVPSHVIRVRCALEVGQMAGHASRAIQVVVVIDVAIGTLSRRHRVQAGQGEAGAVVIEGCIQPACGGVA